MKTWLKPFAVGVAVSELVTGGWLLLNRQHTELTLQYTRNTGPMTWPKQGANDPAPQAQSTSVYVASIAQRCRISAWHTDSTDFTTDIDVKTTLSIDASIVSDEQFNCLTRFVRPPYVTLKRTSS